MKKKQTNNSFSKMLKTVNNYFNRLFFIYDHRDFERLKNFIASWRIWPPQSPKGEDESVFRFRFIDPIVGVENFSTPTNFHLFTFLGEGLGTGAFYKWERKWEREPILSFDFFLHSHSVSRSKQNLTRLCAFCQKN